MIKVYIENKDFTPEEKGLYDKYQKNIKNCAYVALLCGGLAVATMFSNILLVHKPEQTPIVEKYNRINSTLQTLTNEGFDLPYITPEIRKELSGFLDNKEMKVRGLDNAIKIARKDSADVCNTMELRDYKYKVQKTEKINDIFSYTTFGLSGLMFLSLSFSGHYQGKQRKLHHRKVPKKN